MTETHATCSPRAPGLLRVLAVLAMIIASWLAMLPDSGQAFAQSSEPRTVSFASGDGKTTLVGYLFAPAGRPKTAPAVVLMHGPRGAYSSLAKGRYSSVTLEKELRSWAELWSSQGYWALVVDSFGPRGYPAGVAGTDSPRPPSMNEATLRPLDAYGALRYLRASSRVKPDRIALQGWSGTAVLASMTGNTAGAERGHGFRVALALYPHCVLDSYKEGYVPYAPVRIFIGSKDDKASATACEKLAGAGKSEGGDVAVTVFEGATHDFDDPARVRPQVAANVAATTESRREAVALFAGALGR